MASAKFDLTVVVSTPMASLFKRSRVLRAAVHMRKRKVRRRSRMQRKLEERVALRQKLALQLKRLMKSARFGPRIPLLLPMGLVQLRLEEMLEKRTVRRMPLLQLLHQWMMCRRQWIGQMKKFRRPRHRSRCNGSGPWHGSRWACPGGASTCGRPCMPSTNAPSETSWGRSVAWSQRPCATAPWSGLRSRPLRPGRKRLQRTRTTLVRKLKRSQSQMRPKKRRKWARKPWKSSLHPKHLQSKKWWSRLKSPKSFRLLQSKS
mmetsp:Transcript_24596/g.53615  ORF Transcript_24596/g.53615 Transcript_24596/m.53615 type:complete len:261 (+) Transcript_24596:267-1049(+)